MGSLLKNTVATSLLTVTMLMFSSYCTASTDNTPAEPLSESYYPAYPPTKTTSEQKEDTIKRGEYLAKMGDCISCHTNVKGGTPAYAGGLSIATPFGTFYTPNITPDKKTGIGTWTEEDFIRALKEGRDPKGRNYFPVFPYVYFANTSDEDLRALYAYFMSIPAVEQENIPLPFPFNVPGSRSSLIGWKLLFFYPNEPLQYDATQTKMWNRGKYIVDGLGHCSMCHTPLNALGSPKTQYYLTGGFIDGYWAPNITHNGLESATHAEVADVFVKNELLHHAGPVAGPMAEVNHNSLNYMTEEDRLAIAVYLKTAVSEEPNSIPPSQDAPNLRRGKQVYMAACVLCHQNGEMTAPRIGNGPSWYNRLKNHGLNSLYRHAINGYNSMPIKGACVTCSDNDIISSVDYILDKSLSRSQRLDLSTKKAKKLSSNGRDVYNENCSACHTNGKSGAPILGDKKAWDSLATQTIDVLVEQTINGQQHPANGGCKQCSTGEILNAIKYILNQSTTQGNYSLW